jgi:hypothetical protein
VFHFVVKLDIQIIIMSFSALNGCSGAARAQSIKTRAAEWCNSQTQYHIAFCLVQLVLIFICAIVAFVELVSSITGSMDDVGCSGCSEGPNYWTFPPWHQIPACGRVITAVAVFFLGAFGSSESLQQSVRYALL